jgi:hypothetical protein
MRIRDDRTPRSDFERELLAEEPGLTPAAALCIEAWSMLDSCRPIGFSAAGKIPLTAILTWAEHTGLTPENTDVVIAVITKLDNERMDRIATEARTQ